MNFADSRRFTLVPHPVCKPGAVRTVVVDVGTLPQGVLALRFVLEGDLRALRVAEPGKSERVDELWRHTCFEAFVAGADGAYSEFNLAPSGAWAAYAFDGYRSGMRPLDLAPRIETEVRPDRLELRAQLDLSRLTYSTAAGPSRLGASAVFEDCTGGLSYWALRHAAEKPDFHHADGFVVALGALVVP